jgi:hypothetical protein
MIFRSSNMDSPVTFGRVTIGNPAISSSGVDATFVVVRRARVEPCCYYINYL